MIVDSILLTVYNRSHEVLDRVLRALLACDLNHAEIIVIDDGAEVDYSKFHKAYADHPHGFRINWHKIDTLKDLPDAYHINGLKNPAYAWTSAVVESKGRRLWFVSSDCIVPAKVLERGRWFLEEHAGSAYHARTVNSTGQVFCGYERPAPLGWFLGMSRRLYETIGGHDLGYMGGIAFEDADLAGRILQTADMVAIDRDPHMDATVIHQDHPNVAYSDGGVGWRANETYTLKKWDGKVPFENVREAVPHYRELTPDYIILRPRGKQ